MKKSIQLADFVFEKLEEDILIGKYEAGTVLTEIKLSQELGVSRTPLREALNRLRQEGLIADIGKGILVKGITERDLIDIYEVRMLLEGNAVALATINATEDDLKALRQALDMEEFFTGKGDYVQVSKADEEFHAILYRISGSAIYQSVLSDMHRRIKRYRAISIESRNRGRCTVEEHDKIYRAMLARDDKLASTYAVEHIKNARDYLLRDKKEV